MSYIGRGVTTQVWRSDGVLLRKGTTVTLILWVVGIVLRIAIGIVAQRAGVTSSVTTGEIPLFLGVTLAAQNVVIWRRGQEATVPSGEPAH